MQRGLVAMGGGAIALLLLTVGCALPSNSQTTSRPEDSASSVPSSTSLMPTSPDACLDLPHASPAPDEVLVYFSCGTWPDRVLVANSRPAPPGTAEERLAAAVGQLMAGTTDDEEADGLTSVFSERTAGHVNAVTLSEDGLALIDFSSGLQTAIPWANATTASMMMVGEIEATVFGFAEVRDLELHFDGSCGAFATWQGWVSCRVLPGATG